MMHSPANRRNRLTVAVLLLVTMFTAMVAGFAPAAHAQTAVVGSADFRNAPQLTPGTFSDRIVTGDSAWYAVVYTNNTAYQFEVNVRGINPGAAPELDLTASFVAPTLVTIDGPAAVVTGNGVEYPAGHTNVWFLKVTLNSSAQQGVEYPIEIRVDGVQTVGTESCSDIPGCTLDDEYAAINVDLAQAQAELERVQSLETIPNVERDIENAQGFLDTAESLRPAAEARLGRAEAAMSQLCDPEPMCETFPDPGSKTPIIGWLVGGAVLGFGAFRAFKKFTGDAPEEGSSPRQAPSALAKANAKSKAEAKAKK